MDYQLARIYPSRQMATASRLMEIKGAVLKVQKVHFVKS